MYIASCRVVLNPDWCRICKEMAFFYLLNLGTLFRCYVHGQGTLSSYDHSVEMAAGLYALREVIMAHE